VGHVFSYVENEERSNNILYIIYSMPYSMLYLPMRSLAGPELALSTRFSFTDVSSVVMREIAKLIDFTDL